MAEISSDKDRSDSSHYSRRRDDIVSEDRSKRSRDEKDDRARHRNGSRDGDDHRSRDGDDHRSRDGDDHRSGDRDRRERDREKEMERRRHDKDIKRGFEGIRSRDRPKNRETEREVRETDSRKFEDEKELEPEVDQERDQRTVFVYQMPLKARERDIYEFFSQVGKVRDVRLITDRNSRRSKGVGYVEFYDAMVVPQAFALSGQLFLGQPVMVKSSEAEKNKAQSTTDAAAGEGAERKLYVGNLHFNIREEQLLEIFEAFGLVELVQLPLDVETGHCRGYGFIQFVQVEHAKAALSLNGKLEIAGRLIKVSAVTDHDSVYDAGTNGTDFDDDDGGGFFLNARSRASLMQKLDRTGTASSIAESLGVPVLNGAARLPINVTPSVHPVLHAPSAESVMEPSECLLLQNMFDPKTESNPDFDEEIKDDVRDECLKFGLVKHIYVDKNSNGRVYLRFENVAAASNCQRAMHGRWFAGRTIIATYMRLPDYEAKFGRGT